MPRAKKSLAEPTNETNLAESATAAPAPAPDTAVWSKCRIRPIRDNIVVFPDPDPETSESGRLYIPKASVEMKKFMGTVVAVGGGHMTSEILGLGEFASAAAIPTPYSVPLQVLPGDRVIYDRYAGSLVSCDGVEYVLIKESNVLAVVSPKVTA